MENASMVRDLIRNGSMGNQSTDNDCDDLYTFLQDGTGEFSPITKFEFMADGVLLAIVCMFGIIGNTFSLIVLSQPQMRCSIHYYLQHLAVYDTLFLFCKVCLHVIFVFGYYNETMMDIFAAMHPGFLYFIRILTYMVRMGSVWTTVAVSVERYVVVCHPIKAMHFCTFRKTIQINIAVLIFVVVYNIPHFFVNKIVAEFDEITNETIKDVVPTDFGNSDLYLKVYETWMNCIVNSVIPLLALICFNTLIYRAIKRARNLREEMSQKQETDIKLCMMLFCVVIIFLICYTPSFIFGIAETAGLSQDFGQHMPTMMHLMEGVNSAVNFIVYCVMGQNFRNMVLYLFCRRELKRMQTSRK